MKLRATLLAFTALSLPASAMADDAFDGWDIDGSNSLRWENYNLDGNRLSSPYMTGGSHYYNEFDINVSKSFSQYRRLRAQAFGVANNSDYRQTSDGIVPERLHITYEDGETGIPLRVEAGDYFANISYRTLQRSLKGASVEIQPDFNTPQQHSLLLFSGAQQADYRNLDFAEDYWQGGSWLVEDSVWGRFSANLLWNRRDEAPGVVPGPSAEQLVSSATFSTPFEGLSQKFTAEGEFSEIAGDDNLLNDTSENGYFGQLSSYGTGSLQPLDYRLRFEQYGADYFNTGTVVPGNRKSEEAHAGWQFDNGFRLRGRAQSFQDGFDATANQLDTNVIGGGVSGPLDSVWQGSTVDIDAFQQDGEDELLTTNYLVNTLNINSYAPLNDLWTLQKNLFLQFFEDNTLNNRDRETKQLGFNFIRTLQCEEWSGSVGPGFVIRAIDGPFDEAVEIEPTLTFDISNGEHFFSMSYGYLNQNRDVAGTPDLATQTLGLDYRYLIGDNEFGAYASMYEREVDTGIDTEADRVGVYWTHRFNQPASGHSKIASTTVADTYDSGDQVEAPVLDLAGVSDTPAKLPTPGAITAAPKGAALLSALKLGEAVKAAEASIAAAGYGTPANVGGNKVYALRLLGDIPQRQRLSLEGGNTLDRTVLIIEPDDHSAASIDQLYARVRDSFINSYGRPAEVYDAGNFGGSPTSDISSSRVIRATEWETDQGMLRLGIPYRSDGQLRIEVQHAENLPSPRSNRWGSLTH